MSALVSNRRGKADKLLTKIMQATQSLQNGWFGVDRGHSRQCWSADMRQQHLQRHMVARHTIQSCSVTLNVYYILGQQKLS